jgi:sulfide:quinone oxidoreductase
VAALEAALALRELAGERIAVVIATAAREFVYRPFAVVRSFRSRPTYRIELARIAADLDAELVAADAIRVEGDFRQVVLSDGQSWSYDALLIAIGARAEAVVGAGTLTPWDWGEGYAFGSMLDTLSKSEVKSVSFIVPAGLTWPLPLYELALLTSTLLRDKGVGDVSLSVVTPESAPLEEFGPGASATVASLLEQRGIALYTKSEVDTIEGGALRTSGGTSIPAAVTVAVPVIRARELGGVATNAAGFVNVDPYCRVDGAVDVFASGDCTNTCVKQGGLAAQQADTAAAGIASLAGAPIAVEPFRPELHAVLLTGEGSLHLDPTGAKPISTGSPAAHPQPAEKIVARYLTPYLAQARPPLPLDTPG